MPMRVNAAAMNQPVALIIEPLGAHRFAYTKVEHETGETVWRWPNDAPVRDAPAVEPRGQIVNIRA